MQSKKNWRIKPLANPEIVKTLSKDLNINPILLNILVQRGITSFDEAKNFFRPSLDMLHDPFLMQDMDKATDIIKNAIDNNKSILIYGDYDVDGTSAVALVYSFFKNIHQNINFYIPDRYTEGYGVSFEGIKHAIETGVQLIISLDCGISDSKKIELAKQNNIEFIVCDHHTPGETLPNANAILNPKRKDCNYPYKELSGCGIGFKLIQAYSRKFNLIFDNVEKYLDLLVASIASDIVPITGENRTLAFSGLNHINLSPCAGMEALIERAGFSRILQHKYIRPTDETVFSKKLNINDLVFFIGPRINAAGRIEHGKAAVEILISDDLHQAYQMSEVINDTNKTRKELDFNITQEALQTIEGDAKLQQRKTTVLYNPDWHKGVVGIVASRLIDVYYRPTIILTKSNGLISGSARSVKHFDLYAAIKECSNLLEHFGGHKYAAGLALKEENLNLFIDKFEEIVSSQITDDMLVPEIEIDAELNFNDINQKFFNILKQFEPFGPENLSPVFITNNVADKGYAKIVGDNHLKLTVYQTSNPKLSFNAIAFNQGGLLPQILSKKPFNICYNIDENHWNNEVSLQLIIKDIQFEKK